MSAESKKTRRDFIRTATVAAATAAATGLGATTVVAESTTDTSITLQQVTRLSNTGAGNHQSLALKRQISNTCLSDSVQIPPKTAPKSAARLTSLQLENSELTEQLLILQADSENFQTDSGKLQADNERLQIELDAAIAQKEQLDDLLSNNTSLIESLARQLDTANNNLSESTEQVTKLTNVILLYQSLDKVDIENAAEDGLENFHGHISSLHNGATILQSKLSICRQALSLYKGRVPALILGKSWMLGHVSIILGIVIFVTDLLLQISGNGTLLETAGRWIQKVVSKIPGKFGQQTEEMLNSLTELLNLSAETVDGCQSKVAEPLKLWIGSDEDVDKAPIVTELLNPLETDAIVPTEDYLKESQRLRAQFNNELNTPLSTAIANRKLIRESIDTYIQQNQLTFSNN